MNHVNRKGKKYQREQSPFGLRTAGNALHSGQYRGLRAPKNGGHGLGVQKDLAFTLTSEHRHAVFTRQRSDRFREDDIASTESAQQDKDATDLIYQAARQAASEAIAQKCASKLPQLIRRLTALECERLQGFPDGWTDLPGASDSARYRALGNSVAIPCVEFIMRGIAMAVEK